MFEIQYATLVRNVLMAGQKRETRNGNTLSVFSTQLRVDDLMTGSFPILLGRKMFFKGVFGELAAILRKPTCNGDFVEQGCNYWSKFADADGSLRVDYGNAWFNFNGFDQIAELKRLLRDDPTSRRIVVSGWDPSNLANLSLPCCHFLYQFYVDGKHLHMKWYQRSVDVMVGLPSDVIFAAAWLIAICKEFGFKPGYIDMDFGDTHIYEEHVPGAHQYLDQYFGDAIGRYKPTYYCSIADGADFCNFTAADIEVLHYNPCNMISFELKV